MNIKHYILAISFGVSLISTAQNCTSYGMPTVLSGFVMEGTYYCGGIWTGEYKEVEQEVNGMPPHWELNFGNVMIDGNTGGKSNFITLYRFDKDHANWGKLRDWPGYKVKNSESFGSFFVIIYNKKLDNPTHDKWCESMLESLKTKTHKSALY